MLKVLFADDEPIMLEGLRLMIDWEKLGFVVCGEALDGEDALQVMEANRPDLVITDIRMPVIDGLDLIRLASARYPACKFILLSGHADFGYARRAMQYGISNYLTKPLEEAELEEAVRAAAEQIHMEQAALDKQLEAESFLRAESVGRLLEEDKALLNAYTLNLDPDWEEASVCCVFAANEGGAVQFPFRLQQIMASLGNAGECRLLPFVLRMGRCGYLAAARTAGASVELASALAKRYTADVAREARFWMSAEHAGVGSARAAFREAQTIERAGQGTDKKGIRACKERPVSPEAALSPEAADRLRKAVVAGELEAVRSQSGDLVRTLTASQVADTWCAAWLASLKLELLQEIERHGGDRASWEAAWFRKDLAAHPERSALEDVYQAAVWFAERRDRKEDALEYEVGDYIRAHFREKLQLQQVAEQFHINAAYLGQRFKRQFGIPFNEFLHEVRMEEAKKLLRRTDLSIADIASRVGYGDTDHFTEKFRTLNGISPSAYKKGKEPAGGLS